MKYCVYITMYNGNLLPKWYIGSSSLEKVQDGYNGSISSKKWRDIYTTEQLENKQLFKTRILSRHKTRSEAIKEELRVQKMHLVMTNKNYFNESYATVNGMFGRDVSGELNPMYNKNRKLSEKHKKNIGISCSGEKNGMYGKTHTSEAKKKIIEGNKKWLETSKGKEAKRKQAEALSKKMIGVPKTEEQKRKMSESAKNKWKQMSIIKCPHCGKEGKNNTMKRWHFDRCKYK